MAFIASFGAALPSRVVTNTELSALTGRPPEWILNVSGIEERRWVDDATSLVDLGAAAAQECLAQGGLSPADLGMIFVSSGTSPRAFPGPAAEIALRLGLSETPSIDVPLASAGSLVGMALATDLAPVRGPILVVATEIMSRVIRTEPIDPSAAILFGDGAGACLIRPDRGIAEIIGSTISTDGTFAQDLALDGQRKLTMSGRSIILQASRKMPRAIQKVLSDHDFEPGRVGRYILHQANQNLIDRVADALKADRGLFYSNIRRYGNTSSASMLIAASESYLERMFETGELICFAAFGAGLQWGSLLAGGIP